MPKLEVVSLVDVFAHRLRAIADGTQAHKAPDRPRSDTEGRDSVRPDQFKVGQRDIWYYNDYGHWSTRAK